MTPSHGISTVLLITRKFLDQFLIEWDQERRCKADEGIGFQFFHQADNFFKLVLFGIAQANLEDF